MWALEIEYLVTAQGRGGDGELGLVRLK